MIARIQTRAAFNAVLELEVHIPLLVKGIALGRADTRGALVRARGVADGGIDLDVRSCI